MGVCGGRRSQTRALGTQPSRLFEKLFAGRNFFSAGHTDAVIRVYDGAGNVIETHGHTGEFKEP